MTAPLKKEPQFEQERLTSEPLTPGDSLIDQAAPPRRPVEAIRLEPKAETASDRSKFDRTQVVDSPPIAPVGASRTSVDPGAALATTAETGNVALFPGPELQEMRSRWDRIQTAFVDDPKTAVHDADGLVSSVIHRLSEVFEGEHTKLEKRWQSGDNLTTEDLRVALQRYRSFFQRLLSV